MADFSARLRDLIASRGVTQSWLAAQAQTTEATISRYLSGIHKPNLDVVVRIARALNVSVDYMMDLSLSPAPYPEPEREISILAGAFRRADRDHRSIVWAALDRYLTAEEKAAVLAAGPGKARTRKG